MLDPLGAFEHRPQARGCHRPERRIYAAGTTLHARLPHECGVPGGSARMRPPHFRSANGLGFFPALHKLPLNKWHSNPNRSSTEHLHGSRLANQFAIKGGLTRAVPDPIPFFQSRRVGVSAALGYSNLQIIRARRKRGPWIEIAFCRAAGLTDRN